MPVYLVLSLVALICLALGYLVGRKKKQIIKLSKDQKSGEAFKAEVEFDDCTKIGVTSDSFSYSVGRIVLFHPEKFNVDIQHVKP